jgi:hypothetical protein
MVNVDIPGGVTIISGLSNPGFDVGRSLFSLIVSMSSDSLFFVTSLSDIRSFTNPRGVPERKGAISSRRTAILAVILVCDRDPRSDNRARGCYSVYLCPPHGVVQEVVNSSISEQR